MKKLFLVAFSFSMLLILSCGPNYIFDESKEIEGGEWAYVDTLNFEVDIKDTLEIYNLYLDIEHSTDFSKQNIYIQIYTHFPSGQRIKERVAIDFADKLSAKILSEVIISKLESQGKPHLEAGLALGLAKSVEAMNTILAEG